MLPPVRMDWSRNPVSIHHDSADVLTSLLNHLRDYHGLIKRSIPMQDRENGGFVAFLYQSCDPEWVLEWENNRGD